MNRIRRIAERICQAAGIISAAFAFSAAIYWGGRKKERRLAEKKKKLSEKAELAEKNKEAQIEETDAHTLIGQSSCYENYCRAKKEFRESFGDRADEITEAFFRG